MKAILIQILRDENPINDFEYDAPQVLQDSYDQWDVWAIWVNDTHQCGGYYGYDYAKSCITDFVPDFDPEKAVWVASANGWITTTTAEGDF